MDTPSEADTQRTGPLVLVVEDDEDIRDGLQDCLEDEGFDVIPASSGKQALDYLNEGGRPDVILLDLMLPIINGWQVLQEIKTNPMLRDLPTIVVTAMGRDRPSGVSALVRKPFSFDDLLLVIRNFLPKSRLA